MTTVGDPKAAASTDGGRGERTRLAILKASRQLFLERGFAGTPISAITAACGISRAGFYTYFRDKREIFNVIGQTVYRDLMTVLGEWGNPDPVRLIDLHDLVERYFEFLDRHGAFVLASAHSAPTDDEFRRSRDRMVARSAWILGQAIVGRGERSPNHSPEVIGVAATALLERSWYSLQTQSVHVERAEIITVVTEMLFGLTPTTVGTQTS